MERMKLTAEIREETGKNKVKKLRDRDLIPACLYKAGEETLNIKINKKSLYEALHTKAGENILVDLAIESHGKKPRPVMIKEVQYHPVKNDILHADFNEISLTKEIKVKVPIVDKGKPDSVTRESGTLEHVMWEVEVECLPTQIPEKIEVNVENLKIGDKILVKDLQVSPGVKILEDPELTVMSAEPPHVEKVEEVLPEEGIAEPEVIAKGKKEEEEEGETTEEAPSKPEKKEEKKSKE